VVANADFEISAVGKTVMLPVASADFKMRLRLNFAVIFDLTSLAFLQNL